MEILLSQLPSGGYGCNFPSVSISPMNFLQCCNYLENVPEAPLEKYLYDIKMLVEEDRRILNCYVMDLDFLIFYKKLITVSSDLTYNLKVRCPRCGTEISKKISIEKDVHFRQIDEKVMNGAVIELCGHKYDVVVPRVADFLKVFETMLRYKKTDDLNMIKTMALIGNFEYDANQIEQDIMGATHEDITLLLALRDIYYNNLEGVKVVCPKCREINKETDQKREEVVTISVDSLIVDFFRELCINSPINGSKILFK